MAVVLRAYIGTTPQFEGTATELLEAINGIASEAQQKTRGWPKSSAVLAKKLRRIAPPLRRTGINVTFPDRKNVGREITIAPVRERQMPSQPSLPLFSNGLNDLQKDACRHRAVTDEEATVTGDGGDGDGDSDGGAAVTANPLGSKDGDGSDSSDSVFPNLAGGSSPSATRPTPKRHPRPPPTKS